MTKIKKANELKIPETVVGLIYGQPGVGKSTLALSMPKPLLIDTDGGVHRIQAEHRCDTVQVESYQDVLDVLDEDLSEYESIVIDTFGNLVKYMLAYFADKDPKLLTKGGTYNIKIWGLIKSEFSRIEFIMRNMGKNMLFVAHQSENKDGDTTYIRVKSQGSAKDDVLEILDFMGYVEMLGKRRSISFSPCDRYYAKNSIKLDNYIEIPTLEGQGNTFMVDYIIKPSVERRKNEVIELEAIKQVEEQARGMIDAKNPNSTLDKWKSLDLNYYSKVKLFQELTTATSLQWNEESKRFE